VTRQGRKHQTPNTVSTELTTDVLLLSCLCQRYAPTQAHNVSVAFEALYGIHVDSAGAWGPKKLKKNPLGPNQLVAPGPVATRLVLDPVATPRNALFCLLQTKRVNQLRVFTCQVRFTPLDTLVLVDARSCLAASLPRCLAPRPMLASLSDVSAHPILSVQRGPCVHFTLL